MATHLFSSAGPSGLACLISSQAVRVITWNQIESIRAFHRTDEHSEYAVVWIRTPEDMFPVEFTEHDPRWSSLLEAFSKNLEGVVPFEKWFPAPLHPVFELNAHGVYSKPA